MFVDPPFYRFYKTWTSAKIKESDHFCAELAGLSFSSPNPRLGVSQGMGDFGLHRLDALTAGGVCVWRNHHSNCNSSCVREDMLWTI